MVTFVAITFSASIGGTWGRGSTEAKAIAKLRESGGSIKGKWMLYAVEHTEAQALPYVDGMGGLCYHGKIIQKEERKGREVLRDVLAG
jgi:hypothetical protein